MAQTEAQKRAQKKYLSNPENKKKRVAYNTERNKRIRHEKDVKHAEYILSLGNDVEAIAEYLATEVRYKRK